MRKRTYNKELRIMVSEETFNALEALAHRRGERRNEMCRRFLEQAISKEAAEDGIDTLLQLVRTAIRDSNKAFEDRIAAITAKSAITSATTMYMMVQLLNAMGHDAVRMYRDARVKGVAYVQKKEDN